MFNLQGKKGLVVGIANGQSIAFGCARAFKLCGAELAITYINEKAVPHVKPLADMVAAPIFMQLDVEQPGEMEALFETIEKTWGKLDFLVALDRFRAEAGPPWAGHRLQPGRLHARHGHFVPFLHSHGQVCRAPDA